MGYDDLNDQKQIRLDPAIQSAAECDNELGSATTRCRFENRIDCQLAVDIHTVMLSPIVGSFERASMKLVLDFGGSFSASAYRCFRPTYVSIYAFLSEK